jgi:pimeloyl-ACP methyl ester carboxylesterase
VLARGLRFHVAEAGAGDPVVLVHGWPQHWWMWRHVVPLLAPHARLVMIDLRGFGWTDAPPGAYDKQTLADDLLAVLDALDLQRVCLMGHDWGAWSGFLACLAEPERFAAFLALGSPRPGGRPAGPVRASCSRSGASAIRWPSPRRCSVGGWWPKGASSSA